MIPSHRLTTYGRRAFSVAGLMFWNSLPRHLRDPSLTDAVFGRLLTITFFSHSTSVHSASDALTCCAVVSGILSRDLYLNCLDMTMCWHVNTTGMSRTKRHEVMRRTTSLS